MAPFGILYISMRTAVDKRVGFRPEPRDGYEDVPVFAATLLQADDAAAPLIQR